MDEWEFLVKQGEMSIKEEILSPKTSFATATKDPGERKVEDMNMSDMLILDEWEDDNALDADKVFTPVIRQKSSIKRKILTAHFKKKIPVKDRVASISNKRQGFATFDPRKSSYINYPEDTSLNTNHAKEYVQYMESPEKENENMGSESREQDPTWRNESGNDKAYSLPQESYCPHTHVSQSEIFLPQETYCPGLRPFKGSRKISPAARRRARSGDDWKYGGDGNSSPMLREISHNAKTRKRSGETLERWKKELDDREMAKEYHGYDDYNDRNAFGGCDNKKIYKQSEAILDEWRRELDPVIESWSRGYGVISTPVKRGPRSMKRAANRGRFSTFDTSKEVGYNARVPQRRQKFNYNRSFSSTRYPNGSWSNTPRLAGPRKKLFIRQINKLCRTFNVRPIILANKIIMKLNQGFGSY